MTAFIYVNRFLPVKRLMNIIRRFFSEPEALRKLNKGQSFALCVFVYSHVRIDFLLSRDEIYKTKNTDIELS